MNFFASIQDKIGLTGNWLLILLVLAVGFGYGIALGKNRLNLITLATFFSLALSKAIPWTSFGFLGIKSAPNLSVQIFLFLAIILAIFFIAPHTGMVSVARITGRGRASWWQLGIFGILQLGLLISIVVSFLPTKTIEDLNPLFKQFFITDEVRFLWLLLPIVAMMVLRKRKVGED